MRIGPRIRVLLLSPLGLFLVVSVLVPAVILFGYSLFTWRLVEPTGSPSLSNYASVVTDPLYRQLLWNTLVIAVPVTAGSVVGGYAIAYYIVFGDGPGRSLTLGLVITSLMASFLVRVFAWRILLGSNGMVNSVLLETGLIDEPLGLLLYSPPSAILAMTALLMPLAALTFYAALSGIASSYREASRDLGAGRAQTLYRITLPLTGTSILAMSSLIFFLAAGDYVTPVFIGGASTTTLGTVIAQNMGGRGGDYGLGAAIAFLLLVVFIIVYLLVRTVLRAGRLLPDRTS